MLKLIKVAHVTITTDLGKWKSCIGCNNPGAIIHWNKIKGTPLRIMLPCNPYPKPCGAEHSWQLLPEDAEKIGSWNGVQVDVCDHMLDGLD